MKVLPAVGVLATVIIGGIGLSAAVDPPLFGAVSGYISARWWEHVAQGKSTLTCGGHQRMTFTGKHFTATDADLTGPFDTALIFAGGQCELTLIDCELEAPNVIQADGTAMIHITGGKLTATGKAIDIGGDAAVEVSGTSVVGAVESEGHAHLVGIAPQKRTGAVTGNR